MTDKSKKSAGDELGAKMRDEWDRRIEHDYRYWMSDGIDNDEHMFSTGKRDLEHLLEGLDFASLNSKEALDLGCGVGRLLNPASDIFGKVTGVDVSRAAVEKARELLSAKSNAGVELGNGTDLDVIPSDSIDICYSFAALGSMPVSVFTAYLLEMNRVLKSDGVARIQFYLGQPQGTVSDDSIALRSYDKGRFVAAAQASGFEIEFIKELILPFEISDEASGLVAMVASLKKASDASLPAEQIQEILLPGGEATARADWAGSETEYLMAIARATQHLDAGDTDGARKALEFAVEHYGKPEADVEQMLESIRAGQSPLAAMEQSKSVSDGGVEVSEDLLALNLSILSSRFPEAAEAVKIADTNGVESQVSSSGDPVIYCDGKPLDQPNKPARSGEVWADRALNTSKVRESNSIVVVGFAGGYHLKALIQSTDKEVHVVEPNPSVLRAALNQRDCSFELEKLASVSTSIRQFINTVRPQDRDLDSLSLVIHPQTQALHKSFVGELRTEMWSGRKFDQLRPSIAVVGPVYGGSQPIAGYVYQALKELGHRVQYYDLSDFNTPYRKISDYIKDQRRADTVQSTFVEMLSDIVLEGVTERPIDILISLAQAPLSGRVLTELRNRGVITAMWFVEDCRRFLTWQSISKYYDYMFLIQKDPYTKWVEESGAGRSIYLPLACSPEIHKPQEVSEDEKKRWGSPVSFVGAGYNNRQQMFASMAGKPFKIWGTEWPKGVPFDQMVQEDGRRVAPEEYVKVFNSTEVNLNLHSSSERDGVDPNGDFVNPRTFELAATGAFQLTDERTYLPELFEEGKEIVTFSNGIEMNEKISHYLNHPEERLKVTEAARKRVLAEHTYKHRVEKMLSHIYADQADFIMSRVKDGPWPRTLKLSEKHPELHERFEKVYQRGDDPKLVELVADIQLGQGSLSEAEQKLMFLFNLKSQISYVNKLRTGDTTQ